MGLWQDVRHAIRLWARAPGVTLVALVSIAISVGATAVVFAAVKAVLLTPFPYSHPQDLVQIRTEQARSYSHADWVAWNDMQDVIQRNRTLESVGTYHYSLVNLSGDGDVPPEALYGLSISASVFPTLGVTPMLGRNILPEEDQAARDREMILSYELWTRRFHSDRGVIGRSVEINGHASTIIGVMPPDFDFPLRLATTVRTPSPHMDFWAAMGVDPAKMTRAGVGYGAVARLRKGVSIAQADQDLRSISAALEREYPRTNEGRSLRALGLRDRTLGFARIGLLLVLSAAALFMLIGCANVANLLLARAIGRSREIAVRLAIGAGRARIVRQLVTESCVLAIAGGIGGYAVSVIAWRLLPAIAPMSIPRLAASRADGTVLLFALAVSLVNGILFGIAPAFRAARREPNIALAEAGTRGSVGGSRNLLRSGLVIAEVAVAVVLVVIGGLLTGSFVHLLRTDPGFDADHVLASIIVPTGDQYKTPESRAVLYRRILDSMKLVPGVISAGAVDALPFSGENYGGIVATDPAELKPGGGRVAEVDTVSEDYLQTLGIPLLEGRWFREEDTRGERDLAMVNDVAAARLWPKQSAIGKRICVNCSGGESNQNAPRWREVVGVAGSVRHASLGEPADLEVYLPTGSTSFSQFLVIRTRGPVGADVAQAVRRVVAGVDPKQPVFLSATMSSLIADSVADRRFIMTLLTITGCLALLLAAAGVYGVVSYATSRRTQEIGVRMALGASPRQVQSLVFRQGIAMSGVGIFAGGVSSLLLARVLRNVLAGLSFADPALSVLGIILVLIAATVACLIPARRATRIDPISALRQE